MATVRGLRLVRVTSIWLLAALLTVALAACAPAADAGIPTASENPGAAPANANPVPMPEDPADAALRYAQCIRANGYPEWPDPDAEGRIMITRGSGMGMNDPRRLAAMEACQHLRPEGAGGSFSAGGVGGPGMGGLADGETMLAFAQCMRENGVPDFPDPAPNTGGRVVIGPGQAGSSLNPNDPKFQAAMQICRAKVLEGAE